MDVQAGYVTIPDRELAWSFARSGGPGGQNVNKVASKAVLRWDLARSTALPAEVADRFRRIHSRRLTSAGEVLITSERFRDQDRNRQDCLAKLQAMLLAALHQAKPRRPTRPTRGSRQARLRAKRRHAAKKAQRLPPANE